MSTLEPPTTPEKTLAKRPTPMESGRLLLPLLGERAGVRGLPGNQAQTTQTSPEATQRRVRRLIQQLARRIQDRRLASATALPVIPPRSVKPGATADTPEATGNGIPPTSPPNPAQPAPSTLLRRLVAHCSRPPQRPEVRT